MAIFVYNNVGDLEFNTLVYCLMRAWHLPDIENIQPIDQWFAVPTVKIGPIYSNFDYTALMMIDDDGRLVKAHRVNLNIAPKIDGFELDELKKQAFNISLWEETNQKEFPYSTMFDPARISQRYALLTQQQQASALTLASPNIVYNKIRETVKPKPCNCGKK
jgi:hypothetical protein